MGVLSGVADWARLGSGEATNANNKPKRILDDLGKVEDLGVMIKTPDDNTEHGTYSIGSISQREK